MMTSKRQSENIIPKRKIKHKLRILRSPNDTRAKPRHPYYAVLDTLDKAICKLGSVPAEPTRMNSRKSGIKSAGGYVDSALNKMAEAKGTSWITLEPAFCVVRDVMEMLGFVSFCLRGTTANTKWLTEIRDQATEMLKEAQQMITVIIVADEDASAETTKEQSK
jgi:hypothetical protein